MTETLDYEKNIKMKLLRSLIEERNIIVQHSAVKLFTANKDSRKWLFSDIQGIIFLCIDLYSKNAKFLIYSFTDLSFQFEFEFYYDFQENYNIYNPLFQYFEVSSGFIGFKFSNIKKAEEFYKSVKNLNDAAIKKVIQVTPVLKDFEVEENFNLIIKALRVKLGEEYLFKSSIITERSLVLNHQKIDSFVDLLKLENNKVIVNGSRYDVNKLIGNVINVDYVDNASLKIKDSRAYAILIYKNILNSLQDLEKIPYNPKSEVLRPSFKEKPVSQTQSTNLKSNKQIPIINNTSEENKVTNKVPNVPTVPTVPKVPNLQNVPNVPKVPNVPTVNIITNSKAPPIPQIKIVSGGKGPKPPVLPDFNKINAAIAAAKEAAASITVVETKPVMSQEDKLAEIQAKMQGLKKAEENLEVQTVKPKMNMQDELRAKLMKRSQLMDEKTADPQVGVKSETKKEPEKLNVLLKPAEKKLDNNIIGNKINEEKQQSKPSEEKTLSTPIIVNSNISVPNNITKPTDFNNVQNQTKPVIEQPVEEKPKPASNVANFREQLMNKMMGKTTTQPAESTSNNFISNVPKKDDTGKIIIEVPEGTKDSDRLNINKLINEANMAKQNNIQNSAPVVTPKVVESKAKNVPKPPMISIPKPKK